MTKKTTKKTPEENNNKQLSLNQTTTQRYIEQLTMEDGTSHHVVVTVLM